MNKNIKKRFAVYCAVILVFALAMPALAADDPLAIIGNLSDFIFALIRAIGLILLGWGVVQLGLSLKGHDPQQRAQGMLTLCGGLIVMLAKEIIDLITG